MKLASLLLAVSSCCLADFVPVRVPRGASDPVQDRVLASEARYLIDTVKPEPIPNELEHAIRPLTATAFTLAACVRLGPCADDPRAERLALDIVQAVAAAHRTGGSVTANGRPWGHHWQSALWAWQAAFAAWLLQDKLPADVRAKVEAMTIDEADRFIDMPAPYAQHFDTKAEENAWNSHILVLASEALPRHPHAARWRERAVGYMISAFATRADLTSNRLLDGKPLKQWLRGVNVHSDYTLENHGFVHPDYMTTFGLNLMNAIMYRLLDKPVPQACTYNAAPIYENLKWMSLPDGGLLYPSGTDWNLHRIDMTASVHAQMERVARDPDAGALARLAFATIEKMQARTPEGRTFLAGEYPSYPGNEPHAGWMYAVAALSTRLWPAPPKPNPIDEVWSSRIGGRMLPDARMFVVRSKDAVSSSTWGLRIMGQTVPFREDWMMMPLNRSYVGLASPPETDRSPGRLGTGSNSLDASIARDPLSIGTVLSGEESGAMFVTASTRHGSATHVFSFTALPSGKTVYVERWRGARGFSGLVSLLEQGGWVYGKPARAVLTDNQSWLNVDDVLGFAVSGGTGIKQMQDVQMKVLALNAAADGDTVIVTLPNATAKQTHEFSQSAFRLKTSQPDVLAAIVDGMLVVTNVSPHPQTADIEVNGKGVAVPVSGISTRVLRLGTK